MVCDDVVVVIVVWIVDCENVVFIVELVKVVGCE